MTLWTIEKLLGLPHVVPPTVREDQAVKYRWRVIAEAAAKRGR